MTFNTYEQRAKAVSVFEPLVQKAAARLGATPFMKPSSEMAMASGKSELVLLCCTCSESDDVVGQV